MQDELYSQIHEGQYDNISESGNLSLFQISEVVDSAKNGGVEPSKEYLEKSRVIAE